VADRPRAEPALRVARILPPVLMTLVGLGLGWAILTTAVADALAEKRPTEALLWRPDHPVALAGLAQSALEKGDLSEAELLALNALAEDPSQAAPLRVLGIAAGARGNLAAADGIMKNVGSRTHRDVLAEAWLFERLSHRGDYRQALVHLDSLLRTYGRGWRQISPLMVAVASRPDALPAFSETLATKPPWRRRFIQEIAARAESPAVALNLLSLLQESKAPPVREEYAAVVNRLIQDRGFELAYVTWVMSLPDSRLTRLGFIYNGEFDNLPDPEPFNWDLRSGRGAFSEISQGDGGTLLHATWTGSGSPPVAARQLLLLSPGVYRLTGRQRVQSLEGGGDATWVVGCAGQKRGNELAQSVPLGASPDWKPLVVEFEVPAEGCPAQWLSLTRSGGRSAGSALYIDVSYDDFLLQRAGYAADGGMEPLQ
jgi:tetratricopeptide (TPR) repeat protein